METFVLDDLTIGVTDSVLLSRRKLRLFMPVSRKVCLRRRFPYKNIHYKVLTQLRRSGPFPFFELPIEVRKIVFRYPLLPFYEHQDLESDDFIELKLEHGWTGHVP